MIHTHRRQNKTIRACGDKMIDQTEAQGHSLFEPLTNRELEILQLKLHGLSNQEIADQLFIALSTVKWYTRQIYNKLGANNRQEAAERAQALGLFETEVPHEAEQKHNLPAQTTPFVGREKEIDDLTRLLDDSDIRQITILGPGGMGKTRLALEVAEQHIPNFADGVYFVPLAYVNTPEDIPLTIAEQIGFRLERADQAVETQFFEFMRPKSLLLVLDNLEHLLESAQLLSEILHHAPQVKILVTSREKLNLTGETLFPLAGMTLPGARSSMDFMSVDAMKLFMQSARRIQTDFELPIDQIQHAVRICYMVQGMPLALMLAAAWLDTLNLEDIANEINQSIGVLKADLRDAPDRHRSIRAVFDPTWLRLTQEQRAMLLKLSTFQGGFTWQAARSVANADPFTLQTLVNKSLLSRTKNDRYDIQELLRQYIMEQLQVLDEVEATQAAHAHYFATFSAKSSQELCTSHQISALNDLAADYENIRLAWNWMLDHQQYDKLDEMIEALYWLGFYRISTESLFRAAQKQLRPHAGETPSIVWAHLTISSVGFIRQSQSQIAQALEVVQTHGDYQLLAAGYQAAGWLAYSQDYHYQSAIEHLDQALTLYRQHGNDFGEANVLNDLGLVHTRSGDFAAGYEYDQEALDLSQAADLPLSTLGALLLLGEHALLQGDYAQSQRLYTQSLGILNILNSRWIMLWNQLQLGVLAFLRGDINEAQTLASENTRRAARRKDNPSENRTQVLAGLLACLSEDYDTALQLCSHFNATEEPYGFLIGVISRIGTAMAACGLSDHALAKTALRDSVAQAAGSPALITWCLPIYACLLAHQDQHEQAAEILSLAYQHPASAPGWMDQWPLLTRLQAALKSNLGESDFQAAWESGQAKSLETVNMNMQGFFK